MEPRPASTACPQKTLTFSPSPISRWRPASKPTPSLPCKATATITRAKTGWWPTTARTSITWSRRSLFAASIRARISRRRSRKCGGSCTNTWTAGTARRRNDDATIMSLFGPNSLLGRLARLGLKALRLLLLTIACLWSVMAVYYSNLPAAWLRGLATVVFAVGLVVILVKVRPWWLAQGALLLAFGVVLVWFLC